MNERLKCSSIVLDEFHIKCHLFLRFIEEISLQITTSKASPTFFSLYRRNYSVSNH